MIIYLDSSVILRVIFGEKNRLKEWSGITQGFTSAIARVECLRTIHRARIKFRLDDKETARRLQAFYRVYEHLGILSLTETVLERASQPLPTIISTLDAIHLVSACLWREEQKGDFLFATHDRQLANAAAALGFSVIR